MWKMLNRIYLASWLHAYVVHKQRLKFLGGIIIFDQIQKKFAKAKLPKTVERIIQNKIFLYIFYRNQDAEGFNSASCLRG